MGLYHLNIAFAQAVISMKKTHHCLPTAKHAQAKWSHVQYTDETQNSIAYYLYQCIFGERKSHRVYEAGPRLALFFSL